MSDRELPWLIGTTLQAVDGEQVDRWVLTFANGGVLAVGCPWRLVSGHIALSSLDHQQQYGLAAPIDSAAGLLRAAGGRRITAVSIDPATADLRIALEGGERLDIMPFSSGYEAWEALSPDGSRLLAHSGGPLSGFAGLITS